MRYLFSILLLVATTARAKQDRAYLTKGWRATGGVHVNFTDRIILKLEYLHNGEYGGIPQIKDDVFTSSLVLSF